jgi:hypothetical protein
MAMQFDLWKTVVVFALTGCGSVFAQSLAKDQTSQLVASLGSRFVSENATVNGTSIHYVRGGSGPGVILLHGFPEEKDRTKAAASQKC